jgi:hypothetical protein
VKYQDPSTTKHGFFHRLDIDVNTLDALDF